MDKRGALGFKEAATNAFGFLETNFGFRKKASKTPLVTYESDKLKLSVYYDAENRHELDLTIRRLSDDPRRPLSIGIGMLLQLHGAPEKYSTPFPATEAELEIGLNRLADLLRKYGTPLLAGNSKDFERVEKIEADLARKLGPRADR
jgi:hypothetical protein